MTGIYRPLGNAADNRRLRSMPQAHEPKAVFKQKKPAQRGPKVLGVSQSSHIASRNPIARM
jgi:hypothetical protein